MVDYIFKYYVIFANNMNHISNPKLMKKKIAKFKLNNFHIVANFNKTLTKDFVDDTRVQSVYAHLRNGKYLTSEYAKKAHVLFDQYYPYETFTEIIDEERYQKM